MANILHACDFRPKLPVESDAALISGRMVWCAAAARDGAVSPTARPFSVPDRLTFGPVLQAGHGRTLTARDSASEKGGRVNWPTGAVLIGLIIAVMVIASTYISTHRQKP